MTVCMPLQDISADERARYGGKAVALASMLRSGIRVPGGICIPVDVYHAYIQETGLGDRLRLLFARKAFEDMRWEELWDLALRIRNIFLTTPMPEAQAASLGANIRARFSGSKVAVRSSSPAEDDEHNSFAGLHDSFINLNGESAILEGVRLVWASLWSDRALLYRKELGLDIAESAMAVVIQELIAGDCSGIVFTVSPENRDSGLVEAVHGLNQGLVDGAVEPDRWVIARDILAIKDHYAPERISWAVELPGGVAIESLPEVRRSVPPLSELQTLDIFKQALGLESLFGRPQDVEWTCRDTELHVLQARPVTTHDATDLDERQWYLSLHRSLDNLKALQHQIECDILPAMEAEAVAWAETEPARLSDTHLAEEIEYREERLAHWKAVYNREFIPFAHGMRLFGQVYNDRVRPEDPFEFMDLLAGEALLAVKRNHMLREMAALLREHPGLSAGTTSPETAEVQTRFQTLMGELTSAFGDTSWGQTRCAHDEQAVLKLVSEMAKISGPVKKTEDKRKHLEKVFVETFAPSEQESAATLLRVGRASYRLRDNDNLYLGRIEGGLLRVVDEARKRVASRVPGGSVHDWTSDDLCRVLKNPKATPPEAVGKTLAKTKSENSHNDTVKVRQAVGQPAGKGVGVGKAHVIRSAEDLFDFKQGEVLVCDAIDPNMTFIVPLASAVVERRGGMLIHGAIIAREYGIPCVTGVPHATDIIKTGDNLSVDGYLGIIVIT